MSVTYSIACDKCKVSYWCGQNLYLYSAEKLALFLHEHVGHTLRFVPDCSDETIDDYEDWGEQKAVQSD